MGRRFRHQGEEWDVESSGTGHGTGAGEVIDVTDYEVEFTCVSNPSKGPYKGDIWKPNPNEVSEDDLRRALERAISKYKIEAVKRFLLASLQDHHEVQHSYDHDLMLHTFTVEGAGFLGRISMSREYFFDLPIEEPGIIGRLGEHRVPHAIRESNSRKQRVVYAWDERGKFAIRWEPLSSP